MTKTYAELLNCPFCGSKPYVTYANRNTYYYSICCDCKGSPDVTVVTEQESIKIWNTRVNKEAEFLEELKNILKKRKALFKEKASDPVLKGRAREIIDLLEYIEQFQAEVKNANSK